MTKGFRCLCAHGVLAAGALLCATMGTQAASFDCGKAGSPQERAICTNPQLGRLDEEVAAAYKQLLASLTPPWDELVRKSQREWLKSRTADLAGMKPGKEMENSLAASMKQRVDILKGALVTQNGMHFLSVERVLVQKVDKSLPATEDLTYAKHSRTPIYLIDDTPAAKRFNALVGKDFALPPDTGEPSEDESENVASLNFASPELISVTTTASYFSFGAAHPLTTLSQLNYLPGEGRPMTARDLFSMRGYEDIIVRQAGPLLHKADFDPIASPSEIREVLLDPANWALSAQGLTVIIPPDGVFPHAAGSPQVPLIVWKSFQGMLTPLGTRLFMR